MKKIVLQASIILYLITSTSGLFEGMAVVKFLSLLLYFATFLLLFSPLKVSRKSLIVIISLALLLISTIRTNNPAATSFSIISKILSFLFLLFSVYGYAKNGSGTLQERMNNVLLYPLFIFTLFNFIFYLLGFQPFDIKEQQDLGYGVLMYNIFGIIKDRVNFPFVSSVTTFGILMGYLFIFSFYNLKQKINFLLPMTSAGIAIIGIFFVDHRAGLSATILSVLITYIVFKFRIIKGFSITFSILTVVGPLFLILLSTFLLNSPYGDIISRNNSELATGNSRFLIWLVSFNEMLDFKLEHLFGYGELGTFGSGLSYLWASSFKKFADPYMTTAHNLYINIFYDMGYIGVIFFLMVIISIFKNIYSSPWQQNISMAKTIFCFTCFFLLSGITESPIGLSPPLTTSIFAWTYIFSQRLKQ